MGIIPSDFISFALSNLDGFPPEYWPDLRSADFEPYWRMKGLSK
jgi:hypothetical protein